MVEYSGKALATACAPSMLVLVERPTNISLPVKICLGDYKSNSFVVVMFGAEKCSHSEVMIYGGTITVWCKVISFLRSKCILMSFLFALLKMNNL